MIRPNLFPRLRVGHRQTKLVLTRLNSTKTGKAFERTTEKATEDEELRKKEEAAKLAMQSIKDIGTMFSSSSDKETEPINTAEIFESPEKFASLSLLHQGQVLQELQEKYDSKWTKLTDKDKKLGYYIWYGNWGVREKFDNWNKNEKPYDLPFESSSKIAGSMSEKIHKLPPLYLAETPVRKPQFDVKKMDVVTKTFIYITLIICALALYRDKTVGEQGKPEPIVIRDFHEEQRQAAAEAAAEAEAAAAAAAAKSKKWYYLWLK